MIKTWVRSHPLLLYVSMAFGIAWGGIGCVVATMDFNFAAPQPLATGLFFVAMLLGPSVGGLILAPLLQGPKGLRELGSRLLRWRLGLRWYAIALLTAPLILLAILWPMSATVAPAFKPHFQWPLLAIGLVAGGFEEIGWTGFATPRLLALRGVGAAGLQLGLLWALWHALVVFLYTYGAMGDAWMLSFAIVYLATLTPYRILMTWVYAKTQSLLLAVLMHASYTGWLLAVFPATSRAQSLVWQSAFAASLWIAAAIVLRLSAHRVEGRPLAPAERQPKETTT